MGTVFTPDIDARQNDGRSGRRKTGSGPSKYPRTDRVSRKFLFKFRSLIKRRDVTVTTQST